MRDGDLAKKIAGFADALKEQDTDNTFYLISGDLSHVGRKFGDSVPASAMRSDVEAFDQRFIDIAVEGDETKMVGHLAENYDPFRICGFPPLYTFIKMFPELDGRTLNYHWWDESERESAVSFGSILY
jgi:predicted class III extradiol MEMO1 family dioxygenase